MAQVKTEFSLTKQAEGSFYSNTGSQQPPAVTQGHSILIALQMGKKVNECREKPSSACTCILFQPFSPRLTEPTQL